MVDRAKKFGSNLTKGLRNMASTPERKQGDSPNKKGLRVLGRNRKVDVVPPKATTGEVRIGDEINMLEAPWVDCQGVYSCKAIRRSAFVEEAMSLMAQTNMKEPPATSKVDTQQVSSTGAGDGEIPEELSEFMQAQAGGLMKVCPPTVKIDTDSPFSPPFDLCLFHYPGSQCRICWCWCHFSKLYPVGA